MDSSLVIHSLDPTCDAGREFSLHTEWKSLLTKAPVRWDRKQVCFTCPLTIYERLSFTTIMLPSGTPERGGETSLEGDLTVDLEHYHF